MSDYSQIITLANLNTVYEDIRHRIDALGDIYSPQGSLPFNQLLNLHVEYEVYNKLQPAIGHIYNITNPVDPVEGTSLPLPEGLVDGDNLVCIKELTDVKEALTTENYTTYWSKVGGIYEIATDSTAGLVYTGSNEDTPNGGVTLKEDGMHDAIKRGLKNDSSSGSQTGSPQASYITIPLASEATYGLVSTEEQTFSGNKTFKNSSNSNYSVTIKTVNGSTATSEIEIANKSESASTIITPTSISVGGNGSTATGSITISSGNTVANSAEFGTLKVNGTATVAKDATFNGNLNVITTDESGNITGGDVTAKSLITTNIYSNSVSNKTAPYIITDIITTDSLVAANIGTDGSKVDSVYANILDVKGKTVTVTAKATLDKLYAEIIQADESTGNKITAAYMNTLNAPAAKVSVSSQVEADSLYAEIIQADESTGGKIAAAYIDTLNAPAAVVSVSSQVEVDSLYTKTIKADESTSNKIAAAYMTTLNAADTEVTVEEKAVVDYLYASSVQANATPNNKLSAAYMNTLNAANKEVIVETQATVNNLYATNIGTSSDPVENVYVNELKGTSEGNCNLNVTNINVINGSNTVSLTYTNDVPNSRDTAFKDNNTQGLTCSKNFGVAGHIYAYKVHNAVWNDLADAIEIGIKPEPGYCYSFDGEKYSKSTKYCDKGFIGIHSDTFGMIMGEKGSETELNVALAGFVLAYVDKEYPAGTPLTCTKEGYLTKVKKKDLIFRPQRIVATYWKSESKDKWNGVEVLGRKWVKVK